MEIGYPVPPFLFLLLLFKLASSELTVDFESRLRDAAFRSLLHWKTGKIYNLTVLSPLSTNISAQTMRLRTGSLRRRGATFNEFSFPKGVSILGNPRSIFIVYHRINALNPSYLQLAGFQLLSPVVGIGLYNYSVTKNPVEFLARRNPVTVALPVGVSGSELWCEQFKLNVSTRRTLAVRRRLPLVVCNCTEAGDFSVVERSELARKRREWKVILSCGLGGLFVILVGVSVVFLGVRIIRKGRFKKMEKLAENEEILQTWLIGTSRAPGAAGTRTRPVLENEERLLM